jgi:flagellar basal-body rod protein FlgG
MSTRALKTAASGMYAQQLNIEVIANNIANMNTTSFKKNKPEFHDLMYQRVAVNPINSSAPGIRDVGTENVSIGNGVKPSSSQKIFEQGALVQTNNLFDLAINGEGFFQVRRPDGTFAYTRDGSFKLNADGVLVNNGGLALYPDIQLNDEAIGMSISPDGVVDILQANGESVGSINLQLVKFVNPAGLNPIGNNLYLETPASGPPIFGNPGADGFGDIQQGYIESSNVDVVEEMIAMITAQRSYEINSKTVKTVEEMMTMANNLKRG